MNYDPAEYFRLTSEPSWKCETCGLETSECLCRELLDEEDDEEWWENAESEVAALDREEQR